MGWMNPTPLILAALIAAALATRWRLVTPAVRALGLTGVAALTVVGAGVVHPPSLSSVANGIGATLGGYVYPVVGALAFLETGAGVGLVAPGELAVVVGGVTAGQGHVELVPLIAVVWGCAFAGDLTSFALGRRLGPDFLLRHGAALKLTPQRLERVERFLRDHGGKTLVVGRFIGLVRPLAPFAAGTVGMRIGRFVPVALLASGLWSAAFCVLGYLFWQSFDQATEIAKDGSLVIGGVAAAVIALVAVRRTMRSARAGGETPVTCGDGGT